MKKKEKEKSIKAVDGYLYQGHAVFSENASIWHFSLKNCTSVASLNVSVKRI